MRGKVDSPIMVNVEKGITPAYAGKSDDHGIDFDSEEDHPRLCGEKHT